MTTHREPKPPDVRAESAESHDAQPSRAHVLVASDGSLLSAQAARRAFALLAPAKRITLLRVLTHVPDDELVYEDEELEPAYSPEQLAWHWSREIGATETELAHVADVIGQAGVDERIEAGDVARTVCDVARELDVDAIVIGCHARSKVRRVFMRSVSERVLRNAPCPVVAVPIDERDSSGRQ